MDAENEVIVQVVEVDDRVQVIILLADAYRNGFITRQQLINCLVDILSSD